MIRRFVFLAAVAATAVVGAGSAEAQIAQTSRCADCHFANPDAPGRRHLLDWDLSPHGRANVGCEACHGGDASTFESLLAHRDLIPFDAPDSPLTPRNLPRTCGVCHAGPFVAFQDSRHYEMLRNGDRSAPTCATCHGDTAGGLLSARALESRCSSCHGPGETAPRDRRAQQVRELYEEVAFARADLKQAQSLIRRVEAGARRQALEEAYQQAEVPLIQAIQAGHRFVYDDFTERLAVARERTEALLEQLANP